MHTESCFYEILHGLLVVLYRSAIAIVMQQWEKPTYVIYGKKCTADENNKKKLPENNAMYLHSAISAPKVYSNDTIKTVQGIMRNFLLVFLFNNTMPRNCTDNSLAAQ